MQVLLGDGPFLPGGQIEGHVLVTCDDDFQCERLYVSLIGKEKSEVVIHAGKVTIVYREDREHVNVETEIDECLMIPMGESRYAFSFSLPPSVPRSYKGSHGVIKYILEAKAEISWARDLKFKIEPQIGFNSKLGVESIPKPRSGFIDDEEQIILKVETEKDRITLGDSIDFRFFVDRATKIRGVRAEILHQEHVEPKGHETDSKKTLAEIYFPEEEFRRDSWIEASIPTVPTWIESFSTELIDYSHILKVTLDIARRRDKVVEIPIILDSANLRTSDFDF